jgi:hypothetical protein
MSRNEKRKSLGVIRDFLIGQGFRMAAIIESGRGVAGEVSHGTSTTIDMLALSEGCSKP